MADAGEKPDLGAVGQELADLTVERFCNVYGAKRSEDVVKAFVEAVGMEVAKDPSDAERWLPNDLANMRRFKSEEPDEWKARKPWLRAPERGPRLLKVLVGLVKDAAIRANKAAKKVGS